MTAIHTQVSAMTPQSVGESKDDYLERIERTSIVVQRHLAHLTIAAMVVDSQKKHVCNRAYCSNRTQRRTNTSIVNVVATDVQKF